MADRFSCDPAVATQLSRELAEIRSSMDSLGMLFDGFGGATGSDMVERALGDFSHQSAKFRAAMGQQLDRAAGLLRALAEGVHAVDRSLAAAVVPQQGKTQAAAPNASPVKSVSP